MVLTSRAALQAEWTLVFNIGYNVRLNGEDDLVAWQYLKKHYEHYAEVIPVNQTMKEIIAIYYFAHASDHVSSKISFEHVANINPEILATTILENDVEIYHFIVQHFRLPAMANFELSVQELLQIAYNAGQYRACRELGVYSEEINEFYDKHDLSQMKTFVGAHARSKL